MQSALRDVALAWRGLRRNPGFGAAAILTLALGIGANTAIFSWIDGLLLRPLPFPHPEQLVDVWQLRLDDDSHLVSPANFFDWRSSSHSFSGLASYASGASTMLGTGEPALVGTATVSANFFDTIGCRAIAGRAFLHRTQPPSTPAPREIVLGYRLWQDRFGASPRAIGQVVRLDGEPYQVVGVMPRGLRFPASADLWQLAPHDVPDLPFPYPGDITAMRDSFYFRVLGRLSTPLQAAAATAAGTPTTPSTPTDIAATRRQAQAEMDAIAARLAHDYPEADAHVSVRLVPLRDALIGDTRQTLLLLLGAVGCVLLIACVNVANLLLARAAGRRKEIAVRIALGATRGRLIRQQLAEALLISLLGAAAGLLLALPAGQLRVAQVPPELAAGAGGEETPATTATTAGPPAQASSSLSDLNVFAAAQAAATARATVTARATAPRVLAFTLLVGVLATLLIGLAPALASARAPFAGGLRGNGGTGGSGASGSNTVGPRRDRTRAFLVVTELALALVLLAGASQMVESLWRLQRADAGFDADRALACRVSLPGAAGMTPRQWRLAYARLVDGLAALPGVQSAGAVLALPLTGPGWSANLRVEGRDFPPREAPVVTWRIASPGYFRAMAIPILRGRGFNDGDRSGTEPVALVNATLARTLWPHGDALGRHIATGLDGQRGTWLRIVGVIADTPQQSVALPVRPEIVRPLAQDSVYDGSNLRLVVRAAASIPAAGLASAVRSRIRALDASAVVSDLLPLADLRRGSTLRQSHVGTLLALAAGIALLLAAVGLYGVISYLAQQRSHELGVRVALGAGRRGILNLILGGTLRLVLAGTVLGLAGAVALTRLLGGLLYHVAPADPAPLAVAVAVLAATAALASYIPAARAARIAPQALLRGLRQD
jgi:putative ABC transport system permease protein